jgi:hypothetical protein
VGLIPDQVIGIFGRHYGLGFDWAFRRNGYHGYLLGGKGQRYLGLKNLTTFMCRFSGNI